MINDTLYRRGVDTILRRCLTHEEVEHILNDCHAGACGGHLSGISTAIFFFHTGYYWPTLFKDCVKAIWKCHPCQVFTKNIRAPSALLHPVISVGPFAKWGIDFVTCNPVFSIGHNNIIVAVDYFTKWTEALPTFRANGETVTLLLFNQVICHFGVPCTIIIDHGFHFQKHMMSDLTSLLGFCEDQSSSYYPQANGQVQAVNAILKTMICRLVGNHKTHWHRMLYLVLWAYRTSVKSATGFTPFQLAYGLEVVLPIECQIPSLQIAVELLPDTTTEEERRLYLNQLDETRQDAKVALEAHKRQVKAQYDKKVKPHSYQEGDLVLFYDKKHDLLGAITLQTLWLGPYVAKKIPLKRGI